MLHDVKLNLFISRKSVMRGSEYSHSSNVKGLKIRTFAFSKLLLFLIKSRIKYYRNIRKIVLNEKN